MMPSASVIVSGSGYCFKSFYTCPIRPPSGRPGDAPANELLRRVCDANTNGFTGRRS